MSDHDGQLAAAAKAKRGAELREAYLRNQQAVAAAPSARRRGALRRVLVIAAALITLALFVATVVSYYLNPQEEGPTDATLPTAVSVSFMATVWVIVGPYLVVSPSIGARVRNVAIAAVLSVVLALFGIAIFVDLGSLVADLVYNLSH
jgi:threonine/homoserine/homoserine lactone efflux protein